VYSIYISITLALLTGFGWTFLNLWGGWAMGIFIGFVAFAGTWIIIGRKFNRLIQPAMVKAQKLAEAGQVALAINAIESLLPLCNWIPMLKGQLYAQLGVLNLGARKEDQAVHYLKKASNRAAEAKLYLAALFVRTSRENEAKAILHMAIRYNKKHVLLQNFYAFILKKVDDTQGAINILNTLLKKVPENEASADNLSRLKNGKKLSMKSFGMHWYSLGLERPPASMAPGHMQQQQQQPRKGFRHPPKKQKRQKR
jgi:tetratricopeptide (TPR) repeat protein